MTFSRWPALPASALVLLFPALLFPLAGQAVAEEYEAVTSTNVNLRPSMGSPPVAVIPAGTTVSVPICFEEGSYCAVTWNGRSGFVSGDLLQAAIGGQPVSIRQLEHERWAKLLGTPAALPPDAAGSVAPAAPAAADPTLPPLPAEALDALAAPD